MSSKNEKKKEAVSFDMWLEVMGRSLRYVAYDLSIPYDTLWEAKKEGRLRNFKYTKDLSEYTGIDPEEL